MPPTPSIALALTGAGATPAAQTDQGPLARLGGAALTGGGAYRFLQLLTGTIGARQTGTEGSRRAAELLLTTLEEAGLENVHAEDFTLPSSWRRGHARARLISPVERALTIQSYGWAPSTGGEITGPVVDMGTLAPGDLADAGARVRDRIVLADFAEVDGEPGYVNRARSAALLAKAGALALIIPSGKPHGLLDINCFGNVPRAALPMLSIAQEDARFLRRLLPTRPVRLALDAANTLDMTPSTERNVIADWRGSTQPDEIVIISAHLDSWDTATGADDDGSGVAAVFEIARLLASFGIQPRRTIRFAFFSGEEQALLGSHAYVTAHEADLDQLKAVLIMDQGAGAPRGFRLHGRTDVAEGAARVLAPLETLGAAGLSQEASFDQDHAFFLAAGIPAMTLWVQPGDYDTRHHTTTDTLDTIDPRLLAIDTAVMAMAVYGVADGAPIGPRLSPTESRALLQRTGLESSYRLLGGIL